MTNPDSLSCTRCDGAHSLSHCPCPAAPQPPVAVVVPDAAGYYEQFTEFARKLGYLGIAHALDDVMRLRSASELVAERWSRAADKAAEDARAVFKDACNHTQDAIEYMKSHMLAAQPTKE